VTGVDYHPSAPVSEKRAWQSTAHMIFQQFNLVPRVWIGVETCLHGTLNAASTLSHECSTHLPQDELFRP